MSRALAVLALPVAALAATGAEPASAAVSCNFASGALTIQSGAVLDDARILRSGDSILVRKGQADVACGGGQATVLNTHVISYADNSGGETYFTIDLRGGPFSPGQVNEPGEGDEIDIQAHMGAGSDRLYVYGGPAPDFWRFGQTAAGVGVNLNAGLEGAPGTNFDSDVDLRDAELLSLNSGEGDDRVLADGGPEFSGPVPIRIDLGAEGGDDRIAGGSLRDNLSGGPGRDEISGGADDDSIVEYGPIGEDDTIDGGPGRDHLGYAEFPASIRVDLRLTGRQDTGAGGRDAILGIEDLSTAEGDDTVIGTDAVNSIYTAEGRDLVAGLGGDDHLDLGESEDTVSYAIPPAGVRQGVTIDLSKNNMQQNTVGAGLDVIDSAANVIGSPFADELRGSQHANRFEIRDGQGDRVVACDTGDDAVVADIEGVDSAAADCERIELDFRPDTRIDSGPAGLTADATPIFGFASDKQGASFECSVDGGPFVACGTGQPLAALSDGAHTLRSRARDLFGALDLSPAERAFSVDTTPPRISRVRVSRAGRLSYRLSEVATVRIAVRAGKRTKKLVRAGEAGANRIKVRRGRARIGVVAIDLAGNRSKAVRISVRAKRS